MRKKDYIVVAAVIVVSFAVHVIWGFKPEEMGVFSVAKGGVGGRGQSGLHLVLWTP